MFRAAKLVLLLVVLLFEGCSAEHTSFFETWATFWRQGSNMKISLNAVEHVVEKPSSPQLYLRCVSNSTSTCRPKECIAGEVQLPIGGFYRSADACANAARNTSIVVGVPQTHEEAIQALFEQGLIAAAILTPEEMQEIIAALSSEDIELAWIGLQQTIGGDARRKREVDRIRLRAADGTEYDSTDPRIVWATNEPNITSGLCVVLSVPDNAYKMYSCDALINATVAYRYIADDVTTNLTTAASVAETMPPPEQADAKLAPFALSATTVTYVRCADVTSTAAATCHEGTSCPAGLTQKPTTTFSTENSCRNYKRFVICEKSATTYGYLDYACAVDLPGCISVSGTQLAPEFLFRTLSACDLEWKSNKLTNRVRCLNNGGVDCRGTCTSTQMRQPRDNNPPTTPWSYAECMAATYQVKCYDITATPETAYSCVGDTAKFRPCPNGQVQLSNSLTAVQCALFDGGKHVRCVTTVNPVATCRPTERIVWSNSNAVSAVTATEVSPLSKACRTPVEFASWPPGDAQTSYGTKVACESTLSIFTYCYSISLNEVTCTHDYKCLGPDNRRIGDLTSVASCGGTFQSAVYFRCVVSSTTTCRPQEIGCLTEIGETPMPMDALTQAECLAFPTWQPKRCLKSTSADCSELCSSPSIQQPIIQSSWTYNECKTSAFHVRCYNKARPVGSEYSCVSDIGTRCGTSAIQVSNSMTQNECLTFKPTKFVRCVTSSDAFCRPSEQIVWDFNDPTSIASTVISPLVDACRSTERLLPLNAFTSENACLTHPKFVHCYFYSNNTFMCTIDYLCLTPNMIFLAEDPREPDCGLPLMISEWYRCTTSSKKTCRPADAGCFGSEIKTTGTNFLTQAECEAWSNTYIRCLRVADGSPYCAADQCNVALNDKAITSSTAKTYVNEAACLAELYIGMICYTANAASYSSSVVFDTTAVMSCSGVFLGNWIAGSSTGDVNAAATAWYDNLAQPLIHHRCRTPTGPVCRPDMRTTVAGLQCATGETSLATTSRTNWPSLGECLAELFWAQPCYAADITVVNFYKFTSALDTSQGCAVGTEVPLNRYYDGSTADFAKEAAESQGPSLYLRNLPHYRCQFETGGTTAQTCRPLGYPNKCPTGETPVFSEAYSSLDECLPPGNSWKPCYRATQLLSDNFFEIYAGFKADGGCSAGDVSLATDYVAGISNVVEFEEAEVGAVYKSKSNIKHVRCKVMVDGVSYPVCRPDMDPAEGLQCHASDEGGSSGKLENNPPEGYDGYEACMAELYKYVTCYRPTSTSIFYEIIAVHDTDATTACDVTDLQLANLANSVNRKETFSTTEINTLYKSLPHHRCKVGSVPVCRPDMSPTTADNQCANIDESSLQPFQYNNFGDCQAELYWGKSCYESKSSANNFFDVQTVFDHQSLSGCEASNQFLDMTMTAHNDAWVKDATAALVSGKSNKAWYEANTNGANLIKHVRCRIDDATPYCRPKYGAGGVDGCPTGETRLSPGTEFDNRALCISQRFNTKPCYHPTNVAPFFMLSIGFDTVTTNGGCPDGDADVGASYALRSDNSPDYSAYGPLPDVTHYRCKVIDVSSNPVPVCRPMNVATNLPFCGSDELLLDQNNDLVGWDKSSCESNLYFARACYSATQTDPYYVILPAYDTEGGTCSSGDFLLSEDYYKSAAAKPITFSTDDPSHPYLDNTPLPHYRCKVGNRPVCRPISGCDNEDQSALSNTDAAGYETLDACKNELYWVKACYVATNTEPFFDINAYEDTSKTHCLNDGIEIETGAGVTTKQESDDITVAIDIGESQLTQLPAKRCRVGSIPVCRPVMGTDDGCASGIDDGAIVSTSGTTYASMVECGNQRYRFQACYHHESSEPNEGTGRWFTIQPGFDTESSTADWCSVPGDRRVTGSLVYSSSLSVSSDEVSEFETLAGSIDSTTHYRCKLSDSVAVCRPKNYGCASGETEMSTSIISKREWSNLDSCHAVRLYARPCYKPETTIQNPESPPFNFYTIRFAYDTAVNPPVCDVNELAIGSSILFAPYEESFRVDNLRTIIESQTHYRCGIGSGDEVACRPSMSSTARCAAGEVHLTTNVAGRTSWSTQSGVTAFAACNLVRYAAKGCYEPTTSPPPSYSLTVSYDFEGGVLKPANPCESGQLPIGGTTAGNFAGAATGVEAAFITTFKATLAQLRHYRCRNGNDVFCRPSLQTVNNNVICPTGETLLSTTIKDVTTFPTLSNCLAKRYAATGCYKPSNSDTNGDGRYYNIEPGYDHTSTGTPPQYCANGQLQLSNTFIGAGDLEIDVSDSYRDNLESRRHYRCRQGVTPICRPDLRNVPGNVDASNVKKFCSVEADLGLAEIDLATTVNGVTSWVNFANCQQARFAATGCYKPSNNPPYYTIEKGYDYKNSPICGPGELQISTLFKGAETEGNIDVNSYQSSLNLLRHYRCKQSDMAICRPSLRAVVGNTVGNVARYCSVHSTLNLNEKDLVTSVVNGSTSWSTFDACQAVRFAVLGCYHPTSVDQGGRDFYTIEPGYDWKGDSTCGSGQLQRRTDFIGGPTEAGLSVRDYENSFLDITHYRCKNGNIPICRPSLQTVDGNSGHCSTALNEVQLTASTAGSSWANYDACRDYRFAARACYTALDEEDPTTQSYYSITPVYDTDTVTTCATNGMADVTGTFVLYGSTYPLPKGTYSTFYNALSSRRHYRCKNSRVSEVICRPDLSTAVGAPVAPNPNTAGKCAWTLNEINLSPTTSFTTLTSCNSAEFEVLCYNPTITTNFFSYLASFDESPFDCADDLNGCVDGYSQLVASPFLVSPPVSACNNQITTMSTAGSWVRCTKGNEGNDVVKQLVCRPSTYSGGSCGIGEARFGSSTYSSVHSCATISSENLANGAVRCCCKDTANTEVLCGKFTKDASNRIDSCDCQSSCTAGSWTPTRLGEAFIVFHSVAAQRDLQVCPQVY